MQWLRKIFAKYPAKPPWRGRPAVRREKSYASDSGYIYQYFFEGYRETRWGGEDGQEYLFTASSNRVSRFPIRIFLSRKVTAQWQSDRRRELNATEQYALVKMALFALFDRQANLGDGLPPTVITYDEVDKHAAALDLA